MSTASAVSLAEFTIYSILHFSKSMAQFKKYQQQKEWAKNKVNFDKIQSIQDKSALILGYGNIGKKIGEYLRNFKIKNIYTLKKNVESKQKDEIADVIEKLNENNLKKYGEISDYVICCLPGTEELHKVLSEQFFSKIKAGCIFINVGRGMVVDEDALVRQIRNGRILGAGLDVTYNEPYSQDYHLLDDDIQDQLILTSHAMDNNVLSAKEYCEILDVNINHLINETTFINQINIQKGY